MGIFGKGKDKEELALVFDIGSSSVAGALFYMQKSGVPKIIFSIREPIKLENQINFEKFLNLTIKSLDVIVNKICMQKLGAPKKIFCVLSSPWYASQTRIIKLGKNTSFIFNSKLADSLTQKEITLFEEEHLKKYLNNKEKIRPIELKNMKTLLNGYATPNPLNQKTKELEMTLFLSMSPEEVLSKIEESIGKHFYRGNIKFSSFAMASFSVARDMFVHQENFLLVDIGGEVTDISMVKKDILRTSISFPMGRNYMIRGVASALGCTLDEAKSYISLYKDEHMAKPNEKKFGPVVGKLKTEWLKKFQESLVNLSNDISIPATIFITVDQDFVQFFTELIKTEQFNQYTLTEAKFRIIFLGT
ncbi:MAG: hypothetical protein WC662_05165, partial [Candidatus Paceibacterota bacterium]